MNKVVETNNFGNLNVNWFEQRQLVFFDLPNWAVISIISGIIILVIVAIVLISKFVRLSSIKKARQRIFEYEKLNEGKTPVTEGNKEKNENADQKPIMLIVNDNPAPIVVKPVVNEQPKPAPVVVKPVVHEQPKPAPAVVKPVVKEQPKPVQSAIKDSKVQAEKNINSIKKPSSAPEDIVIPVKTSSTSSSVELNLKSKIVRKPRVIKSSSKSTQIKKKVKSPQPKKPVSKSKKK
jgi:hypothetical protein